MKRIQSKPTSGVIRHCSNTGSPCSHNAGDPGLHWRDELQMIPPEVKQHINHSFFPPNISGHFVEDILREFLDSVQKK